MSLDGFIEGPGGDMSRVFQWMFSGDTEMKVEMGKGEMELKMAPENVEHMEQVPVMIGAIVSGRGMFDAASAWGGKHPMNVPVVILTHNPPKEWADKKDSPFTFVTDGIESAIRKAKEIAGDKNIGIGGANVTQQALKLGLLDEIGIDLVPVLLGDGLRLFDHLDIKPTELECISVNPAPGVTHLSYRVIKS